MAVMRPLKSAKDDTDEMSETIIPRGGTAKDNGSPPVGRSKVDPNVDAAIKRRMKKNSSSSTDNQSADIVSKRKQVGY